MNNFNLYCSNCHESFYVDKDFYDLTIRTIENGIDNPFVCDDCQDEVDELGYERSHP